MGKHARHFRDSKTWRVNVENSVDTSQEVSTYKCNSEEVRKIIVPLKQSNASGVKGFRQNQSRGGSSSNPASLLSEILDGDLLFENEKVLDARMEEDDKFGMLGTIQSYLEHVREWITTQEGESKRKILKYFCGDEWGETPFTKVDKLLKDAYTNGNS